MQILNGFRLFPDPAANQKTALLNPESSMHVTEMKL